MKVFLKLLFLFNFFILVTSKCRDENQKVNGVSDCENKIVEISDLYEDELEEGEKFEAKKFSCCYIQKEENKKIIDMCDAFRKGSRTDMIIGFAGIKKIICPDSQYNLSDDQL